MHTQAEGSEAAAQDKVGRKRRPVLLEVDGNRRSKRNSGGAVSVRPSGFVLLFSPIRCRICLPRMKTSALRDLTAPKPRAGAERRVESRSGGFDKCWFSL
jgi:hypothetical protein